MFRTGAHLTTARRSMATKQTRIPGRLVVGLSVLAIALTVRVSAAAGPPTTNTVTVNPPSVPVTVTNTASSPVPTQNVGTGAATAVGGRARQLINLQCFAVNATDTCINADNGNPFLVPAGQVLVITDLQVVTSSTVGQGNYDTVLVFSSSTHGAEFSFQADAKGILAGQVHLATGIVCPAGSSVLVFGPRVG